MAAPGAMAGKEIDVEDLPFEVPDFNEDEFVRKELISFRTTVILFVFALLVALGTFFIWRASGLGFFLLFLMAMAVGALLPFIYKLLRVDISHFRRREWIGTMTLHFFFWLGFTLLLANPPISDSAAPVVEVYGTPTVQGVGNEVRFAAYVGDDKGVVASSIDFCLRQVNATSDACQGLDWTKDDDRPM